MLDTSFELGQGAVTTLSTLAVIVVLAAVTWDTERRARREDRYPFLPACAALLAGLPAREQGALPAVRALARPAVRPRADPRRLVRPFVAGNVTMYLAIFAVSVWNAHARDVLVTWSVWARTATFPSS